MKSELTLIKEILNDPEVIHKIAKKVDVSPYFLKVSIQSILHDLKEKERKSDE